jgi:stress-induced morphogen
MVTPRKKTDRYVKQVRAALQEKYGLQHPNATIEVYRYNPASIRIRIIDPSFAGKSLVERENIIWPIIESLPENVLTDITLLLLLTPKERKKSLGSLEFDDPTPSRL